jgi:LysR family transcriptional activator of nhaA
MLAVGLAQGVRDEFYALSIERRITHRCVVAITEAARGMLG